ncbi:glycosyltransferase [Sinorhizobium numidicum]|uniref:Chitooligosaccharide deacetylase n=1 Tax=Sinorhizobium numidicum TaxID=680248 RepID=A0ABY8CSW3_9HYPH|nr:glycosyltransferase [Sinorhizobium numidicum]WEX75752.1 glycosyltransferase [Sinorhizobium numidicum]WEX81740.1 glycosyltransferase [Sinorhizobium numidicum]
MTLPAITFLIPAYNASGTLAQCIGSLRDQTFANWQAVIVDDGSIDDTFEVAKRLSAADARIAVFRQDNAGAAAARNHAASMAEAPFLCMLDADDWIESDFVDCMLPHASGGHSPIIAHCFYRRVTAAGVALPVEKAPDLTGDAAKREFSSYCALAIHTAVFPRSLFDELGGMDTRLATCEEWDLWLRMAFCGAKFRPVPKCLANYRMRSGSLSRDPMKLVRDAVAVITRAASLRQGDASAAADPHHLGPEISQVRMLAWVASVNAGGATDLPSLAALLPIFPNVAGYEAFLAEVTLHGLRTGLMVADEGEVLECIDDWIVPVAALFDYLEGRSMDDISQLTLVCEKMAAALKPNGYILTAHAHLRGDEPDRTGFDWSRPFGVATIKQTFESVPGLALEKTIETELYAIHLFRKGEAKRTSVSREEYGRPLQPTVAKFIVWGPGGMGRAAAWETETTTEIPVLMYHRIAEEGPATLLRYRTTAEDFRKQLQFLHRQGFYGLNSVQLGALLKDGKPVRGRPVLVTFDDAYADFATDAYPILEDNDFSADVFVVTAKVGGHSDWDRTYGEPAKLMDWDQIRALHSKGVSFGSHLATHRPASSLGGDMLAIEALESRCILERKLGAAVNSIALPYGIADFRVPSTLEKCGYEIAFTTRQAKVSLQDNRLSLPRLEVRGDRPLAEFATLLGLGGAFVG